MNRLVTALTLVVVAVPASILPAAAAKIAQGGKPATLESAPSAQGVKTFLKTVFLECSGANCVGTFKGKAGRLTTITEMQCAASSDGQAQGAQVAVDDVFLELMPIASRATNGATEVAIVRSPVNFVLEGTQRATIGFFFFGNASYANCLIKGMSKPS